MRRPLPHLLRAANGVLLGALRLVALDGELRGRTHERRGKRAGHGGECLFVNAIRDQWGAGGSGGVGLYPVYEQWLRIMPVRVDHTSGAAR